jgi:hypothetical protein
MTIYSFLWSYWFVSLGSQEKLYPKNLVPGYSPFTHDPYEYSYRSCLSHLQIKPLNNRRKFFDIDLVVKSFNGLIDSSEFSRFFEFPPSVRDLRRTRTFLVSNSKFSSIDRWTVNEFGLDLNQLCNMTYNRARRVILNKFWAVCTIIFLLSFSDFFSVNTQMKRYINYAMDEILSSLFYRKGQLLV